MISSIRDFLGVPSPTTIDQIPKEILLQVFEYLPTKDLNAAVLTNKHFLSAARYGIENGHLPDPNGKWVRMLMQVQQIRERAFRCRARGNRFDDSVCRYFLTGSLIFSGIATCTGVITGITGAILRSIGKFKLVICCCNTSTSSIYRR